ncbi:Hypothetical predicted protein, partial [Podarcis lilfordi]
MAYWSCYRGYPDCQPAHVVRHA